VTTPSARASGVTTDRRTPNTDRRRPRSPIRACPDIHTVSFPASSSSSSSSSWTFAPSPIAARIDIQSQRGAARSSRRHHRGGDERRREPKPRRPTTTRASERASERSRIHSFASSSSDASRRSRAYLGGDGGARVLTRDARARAERDQTGGVQREDGGHGGTNVVEWRARSARARLEGVVDARVYVYG